MSQAAYDVGGYRVNPHMIQSSILGIRPHFSPPVCKHTHTLSLSLLVLLHSITCAFDNTVKTVAADTLFAIKKVENLYCPTHLRLGLSRGVGSLRSFFRSFHRSSCNVVLPNKRGLFSFVGFTIFLTFIMFFRFGFTKRIACSGT